jgi:hypothetical protein
MAETCRSYNKYVLSINVCCGGLFVMYARCVVRGAPCAVSELKIRNDSGSQFFWDIAPRNWVIDPRRFDTA